MKGFWLMKGLMGALVSSVIKATPPTWSGPRIVAPLGKPPKPSVINPSVPFRVGSPILNGTLRVPPAWLIVIVPPANAPAVEILAFTPLRSMKLLTARKEPPAVILTVPPPPVAPP